MFSNRFDQIDESSFDMKYTKLAQQYKNHKKKQYTKIFKNQRKGSFDNVQQKYHQVAGQSGPAFQNNKQKFQRFRQKHKQRLQLLKQLYENYLHYKESIKQAIRSLGQQAFDQLKQFEGQQKVEAINNEVERMKFQQKMAQILSIRQPNQTNFEVGQIEQDYKFKQCKDYQDLTKYLIERRKKRFQIQHIHIDQQFKYQINRQQQDGQDGRYVNKNQISRIRNHQVMRQIKKIKNLLQSPQIRQINTVQFSEEDKQKARQKSRQKYAEQFKTANQTRFKSPRRQLNQKNNSQSMIQNKVKNQGKSGKNDQAATLTNRPNRQKDMEIPKMQKQLQQGNKNKNLVSVRRRNNHLSNIAEKASTPFQQFVQNKITSIPQRDFKVPLQVQNIQTYQQREDSPGIVVQSKNFNIHKNSPKVPLLNINSGEDASSIRKSSLKNSNGKYQKIAKNYVQVPQWSKQKLNSVRVHPEKPQQIPEIQEQDPQLFRNNKAQKKNSDDKKGEKRSSVQKETEKNQLPSLRFLTIQENKLKEQKKLTLQFKQFQSNYDSQQSSIPSPTSNNKIDLPQKVQNPKSHYNQSMPKQVKFENSRISQVSQGRIPQNDGYVQSLKCLFKQAIDLCSIAEVIKYNLRNRNSQILLVLRESLQSAGGSAISQSYHYNNGSNYKNQQNRNSPQKMGPIIKRENLNSQNQRRKMIKADEFNKMLQFFMKGYKKSSLSSITKRIFKESPKMSLNDFCDVNSSFKSVLNQKDIQLLCSQKITKIKTTNVSQLLKKLLAAWIQIQFYEDRIKKILKSSTQKLQQFLDQIVEQQKYQTNNKYFNNADSTSGYKKQKKVSAFMFNRFVMSITSQQNLNYIIKNKQLRLRVEIYLYNILGKDFSEQAFIKWLFQ